MAEAVSPCALVANYRFYDRVCGIYLVVESFIVGRGGGCNRPFEQDQNLATGTSQLG